ncbi:ECF transporter S component [Eggerthellaceae bacterium zg-997]|nr:ECF transporter S component [Eggerthellaceae bacterium zg-997]
MAASTPEIISNTNRWDTRQIVTMALMAAIGVLLSFIEAPIMPGVPYLKYDPSAVPALISGFAFGPVAGIAVGTVTAVIHGLLTSNFWGALMSILCVVAFVAPAALIYRTRPGVAASIAGCAAGTALMLAAAIGGNLVVTPLYSGVSMDAVMALIVPVLIPFNLLKAVINSVLGILVHRSVSRVIAPGTRKSHARG